MILLAAGGSCLKVRASGGSSANETSWEISARVLTQVLKEESEGAIVVFDSELSGVFACT